MKKVILIGILFSTVHLFSCQKENLDSATPFDVRSQSGIVKASDEKYNIFKGPQESIGDGKVRSWIKLTHDDKPLELGIEFTPGALTGLPEHGHYSFVIPLHNKAKEATLYEHVGLNWNPEGHEPFNVFGTSHFDAHFMRISNEERMAIPEYTPGSAFDILPAPAYRPQGYVPFPGGIAQMGKHWGAMPFPAPGTFSSVLIYGSYNGRMIFEEPMVTLQHMLNGGASNISFAQPQLFHTSGYYPTKYNVYTSADGHYIISLSNFILRQ